MRPRLIALGAAGTAAVLLAYLLLPGTGPGLPGGDCTKIELNSSIEKGKLDVLGALAAQYNRSGRRVEGRCVSVSVHGTSSGKAKQALAKGWKPEDVADPRVADQRPDVWTPTSSLWLELLAHEGKLKGLPTSNQLTSITQSPLVIGMPRRMAEALGWPGREVSWKDILTLSADPKGWASKGHPEWGRFTFGKDDPRKSTSGLAATAAAYYAATSKSSDLQVSDIENPDVASFVLGVEAGVHHYAEDAIEFLRNLAVYDTDGRALRYISAVVLEEQLIFEYNQGSYQKEGKKPVEPLVALHPTDGTFMMDHPYVILPHVTARQRLAAADFLAYLQEPHAQQSLAQRGFRYRHKTGAWALTKEVAASFGTIEVIQGSKLVYTPSGAVLEKMLMAWDTLRKQASVLFVLDVSGSMAQSAGGGRDRLDVVRDALLGGLGSLPDTHHVGLWVFSDDVNQLIPVGRLGAARDKFTAAVNGLEPGGGTALYRAVREGHRYMTQRVNKDRISAVVVLTDGQNASPDNDLGALLAEIDAVGREAGGQPSVRVFSIAFSEEASFEVMKQISTRTRAEAYDASTPESITKIFVDVLNNF